MDYTAMTWKKIMDQVPIDCVLLESWIYLTKQTFALDHLFRCKERIWICLDVDRESC